MHHGRRRLAIILGISVLALAAAFPDAVAARSIPADVAGAHVWSGQLCDGTALTVSYHVSARTGRAVFDSATGGPVRVRWAWHGFLAHFRGTSTTLVVWTNWRRGVLHLHERVWSDPCPPPPTGDPVPPPDDGGNGQTG
jgi:hypothetical protein